MILGHVTIINIQNDHAEILQMLPRSCENLVRMRDSDINNKKYWNNLGPGVFR